MNVLLRKLSESNILSFIYFFFFGILQINIHSHCYIINKIIKIRLGEHYDRYFNVLETLHLIVTTFLEHKFVSWDNVTLMHNDPEINESTFNYPAVHFSSASGYKY